MVVEVFLVLFSKRLEIAYCGAVLSCWSSAGGGHRSLGLEVHRVWNSGRWLVAQGGHGRPPLSAGLFINRLSGCGACIYLLNSGYTLRALSRSCVRIVVRSMDRCGINDMELEHVHSLAFMGTVTAIRSPLYVHGL